MSKIASHPHISVVSPVYQAENCLIQLHERMVKALEKITPAFEIILVEDGGADRSWSMIEKIAIGDPRVRGFRLSRNFGQHHAITAGLDVADGDWTVVMDCDLQDKPEDIARLYAEAQKGYDMVVARRTLRRDDWNKKLSSRLFYFAFSSLAGFDYDGTVGTFRIMSRSMVQSVCSMREQMRSLVPLCCWLGFQTGSIEVEHDERPAGKSSYTWRKLIALAFGNIIAYSDRPLRLSIAVGLIMAGCALLYGAFVLVWAVFWGVPVSGWSSLMVSVYFIGGLILANLGIIGVYLARTFDETKRRPLYVIGRTTPTIPSMSASAANTETQGRFE